MQTRSALALELENEIKHGSQNEKRALALINLLSQTQFTSLDENQESFLYQSLLQKRSQTAEYLLEFKEHVIHVLFVKTSKEKNTLFHIAAANGFSDMLNKLITLAKEQASTEPDYKYWLHPNKEGDTPLLCALDKRSYVTATLLFKLAMQEENGKLIVTQANSKNLTLCHYVLGDDTSPIDQVASFLTLLMDSKLDLAPAFESFCLQEKDRQTAIFNSLKLNHRKTLLSLYHQYVDRHPSDDKMKTIYVTLSGLIKLRLGLMARFEYDPAIPLRRHISSPSAKKGRLSVFSAEPALELPHYKARFFSAKEVKDAKKSLLSESSSSSSDSSDADNLMLISLVTQDKQTIAQLIDEIHRRSPKVEKSFSWPARGIAVGVPGFLISIDLALLVLWFYFIFRPHHYTSSPWTRYPWLDCNQYETWLANMTWGDTAWDSNCYNDDNNAQLIIPAAIFGYSMCLLMFFAMFFMPKKSADAADGLPFKRFSELWNQEPILGSDNWQAILFTLEEQILIPLFDKSSEGTYKNELIATQLLKIAADLIQPQFKTNAIAILQDLIQTLIQLNDELDRTHLPITSLHEELVPIDEPESLVRMGRF